MKPAKQNARPAAQIATGSPNQWWCAAKLRGPREDDHRCPKRLQRHPFRAAPSEPIAARHVTKSVGMSMHDEKRSQQMPLIRRDWHHTDDASVERNIIARSNVGAARTALHAATLSNGRASGYRCNMGTRMLVRVVHAADMAARESAELDASDEGVQLLSISRVQAIWTRPCSWSCQILSPPIILAIVIAPYDRVLLTPTARRQNFEKKKIFPASWNARASVSIK